MVQTLSKSNSARNFIDQGYVLSLIIISATLGIRPFFLENLLSYSTILFLIFSILKLSVNHDFAFSKNIEGYLLFFPVFLWWSIGILYSTNTSQALKLLETKLGLILIPMFVLSIRSISKNDLRKILFIYSLSITFYLLLSYLLVIHQNYRYNGFESVIYPFYLYHSLVHFIGMHASYMAIQVAFVAIIVLDYLLFHSKSKGRKILYSIWLIFLVFCLFSLMVKMIILAFLLALLAYLLSAIGLRKGLPLFLFFLLVVALILPNLSSKKYFSKKNEFSRKMIISDFSSDPENLNGTWGSTNLRIALTQNAWEVISKNWLIGTGIGDEKEERIKQYQTSSFHYAVKEEFNEHNQYLNVWLSSGIIGLLIFFRLLFVPLKKALKSRNFIYTSFIILISIAFLSEVYLSRIHGVIFFSFFHVLLWKNINIEDNSIGMSDK